MIQSQSYKHIDVNEIVVRKIKNGKIIEKDYFTCWIISKIISSEKCCHRKINHLLKIFFVEIESLLLFLLIILPDD
jgi:hypothetical protein